MHFTQCVSVQFSHVFPALSPHVAGAAIQVRSGLNLGNPFSSPGPHWTPLQWEAESGHPRATLGGAGGGSVSDQVIKSWRGRNETVCIKSQTQVFPPEQQAGSRKYS